MNILQKFFEELILNISTLQDMANKQNVRIDATLDIPNTLFLDLDKPNAQIKLDFFFLQNYVNPKIYEIDENELPVQLSYYDIEPLQIEFKNHIVNKINNFLTNFNEYEELVLLIKYNELILLDKKISLNFKSIFFTFCYLLHDKLIKNNLNGDIIVWYLFQKSSLLNQDFPNKNEIMDNIMENLSFTSLPIKDISAKGAWGGYWKNIVGNSNIFFDESPLVADWYEKNGFTHHAIAVYEYWIEQEFHDLEDVIGLEAVYEKHKESFYPELANLYLKIGDLNKAEKIYEKYLDGLSPDDVLETIKIKEKINEIYRKQEKIEKVHIQSLHSQQIEAILSNPNIQAYMILSEIEPRLKNIIYTVLNRLSKNSREWFINDRNNIYEKIKQRIRDDGENENNNQLIIEYADYGNLKYLLRSHVREFSQILNRDKFDTLIGDFIAITSTRNAVAHFRQIDADRLDTLLHRKASIMATFKNSNIT